MSYGQHFFIRARPGAIRQPDCKAVLLRQRSLTALGWHGPFARHQAATGDEATNTCENGLSTLARLYASSKIDGTQLFEVKLCAAHAGPNRWCASRLGVNGEARDVSAIVWAYCRTDRCIQTSPHRLAGGEAHRWLAHNKQSTGTA